MKDLLLTSTPHCNGDGLKVSSNKVCHSIVNSVTNDEDDWLNSRKNSGYSIVNSVTNDEDEWIETEKNSRDAAVSIQNRPYNYQLTFSKQEVVTKGFEQTESTPPPHSCLSTFERRPFAKDYLDKESFLTRYGDMMKKQEKEQMSTISHLQFFFELLIDLELDGQDGVNELQKFDDGNKGNCLLIEFSYDNLKQAQKKLKDSENYDIVKTDKQFLMVLDVICEERDGSAKTCSSKKKQKKISWAEIIQCYRNCVAGMQTLEIIGGHNIIRKRTKERILDLLSGYRESPFINCSPSIKVLSGTRNGDGPEMTCGRSVINSFKVGQGTRQDTKSNGLLNHPLVSYFIGAMVGAILFYKCSAIIRPITQYENASLVMQTQYIKCPIVVNESFYFMGREFEAVEKIKEKFSPENAISETMNSSQHLSHMGPTESEPSTFKRETLIKHIGHPVFTLGRTRSSVRALLSLLDSSKIIVFDPELSSTANEYEVNTNIMRPPSFDIKVANVMGSTAAIIYFLSSSTGFITAALGWFPTSLGVMMAAFITRSLRDGIPKIWKNFKLHRKKLNAVSELINK